MRVFKIPFDIKREEKIFGGYLSLRQVLYLMLATASLGILATPLNIIIKIFRWSLNKKRHFGKTTTEVINGERENESDVPG